jgi:serine/threonine protein phosphatase 1
MYDKIHSVDFAIPSGMRVSAIGDVHGHLLALERMHAAISADLIETEYAGQVHIVYMGDYIDRGPDSKGVLDNLVARLGRKDGIQRTFLQGNHEMAMADFLRAPEGSLGMDWLQHGGVEALKSYGLEFEEDLPIASEYVVASKTLTLVMPEAHRSFLSALAGAIEIGDYFFAHAGVHPKKKLSAQEFHDLAFIREPFLSWNKHLEKMIVHGHSIAPEPEILPHRIGIDTGVYQPGGKLSAGVFEGNAVRFLKVEPR